MTSVGEGSDSGSGSMAASMVEKMAMTPGVCEVGAGRLQVMVKSWPPAAWIIITRALKQISMQHS